MSLQKQTHRNNKANLKQQSSKPTTNNLNTLPQQTLPATPMRRTRLDLGSLLPHSVLQLQRTIGNKATRSLLSAVQPHLANKKSKPPSLKVLPISLATSLPKSGLIQRTKGTAELRKAFAALEQDAYVTKLPTKNQALELNRLIEAAKTPKERQTAIERILAAYGIGPHGESMEYDPELSDEEAITESDRPPKIGPEIFKKSTGLLAHLRMALTLNHENLHRQQYRRIKAKINNFPKLTLNVGSLWQWYLHN